MVNFAYGYVGIGFGVLLFVALLILSIIDFKTFRLPNRLTLPLIPIGVIQFWVLHHNWHSAVLGALLGYGVFLAIEWGFQAIRGIAGLGRGDAKLLAAGGAWCGVWALPYIILIASLSGVCFALFQMMRKVAPRNQEAEKTIEGEKEGGMLDTNTVPEMAIPFGPFLAVGIVSVWLAIYFKFMIVL